MDWRQHITSDPAVCHGKPCFRGTRILVSVVLDNLAAGLSAEQLRQEYPTLPQEAMSATLAFASELAKF